MRRGGWFFKKFCVDGAGMMDSGEGKKMGYFAGR